MNLILLWKSQETLELPYTQHNTETPSGTLFWQIFFLLHLVMSFFSFGSFALERCYSEKEKKNKKKRKKITKNCSHCIECASTCKNLAQCICTIEMVLVEIESNISKLNGRLNGRFLCNFIHI